MYAYISIYPGCDGIVDSKTETFTLNGPIPLGETRLSNLVQAGDITGTLTVP